MNNISIARQLINDNLFNADAEVSLNSLLNSFKKAFPDFNIPLFHEKSFNGARYFEPFLISEILKAVRNNRAFDFPSYLRRVNMAEQCKKNLNFMITEDYPVSNYVDKTTFDKCKRYNELSDEEFIIVYETVIDSMIQHANRVMDETFLTPVMEV